MGSRALGGRVAPPARAVRCASRRSVLIGRGHPCGCAIKCDHPKKYHLIRHTNERNHTLFTHPGPRAKCGRHHMKYANLCALVCNRVFRKAQTHRARENISMTDDTTRMTQRTPHFARTSANPHKKSTTERLARDLNVRGRAGRCLSRSRGVRFQQLVPTRRHPLAHGARMSVEECARADRCQRAAPPSAATVPEHPTRAANAWARVGQRRWPTSWSGGGTLQPRRVHQHQARAWTRRGSP